MKRSLNLYLLLAVALVAVALSSCDSDVIYDKYNHTPLVGWEKNVVLP